MQIAVRATVRTIVRAIVLAMALAAPPAAAAHEGASLKAAAEIRRDGTFAVDVVVDREHLPPGFGKDAAPREASGAPADGDVRREVSGVLAGFAVLIDGAAVAADAAWSPPGRATDLHLLLTGALPFGARSVALRDDLAIGNWAASVRHEGRGDAKVVFLDEGEAMPPVPLDAAFVPKSAGATFVEFAALGFTHIVPGGLDHILFVLGLFLLSTRLKPLLAQVTAFTLAHTATLALAVTGVVALPSSVVEPLIAASIVYVGVENLCTRELRSWRVLLVFGFGLLHGLGFAGVLAELGLPPGGTAAALVSFNVGVELGQLAVLLGAWTLFALPFRTKPWYRRRIVVPGSLAIAATGLWWAVTRIVG